MKQWVSVPEAVDDILDEDGEVIRDDDTIIDELEERDELTDLPEPDPWSRAKSLAFDPTGVTEALGKFKTWVKRMSMNTLSESNWQWFLETGKMLWYQKEVQMLQRANEDIKQKLMKATQDAAW